MAEIAKICNLRSQLQFIRERFDGSIGHISVIGATIVFIVIAIAINCSIDESEINVHYVSICVLVLWIVYSSLSLELIFIMSAISSVSGADAGVAHQAVPVQPTQPDQLLLVDANNELGY